MALIVFNFSTIGCSINFNNKVDSLGVDTESVVGYVELHDLGLLSDYKIANLLTHSPPRFAVNQIQLVSLEEYEGVPGGIHLYLLNPWDDNSRRLMEEHWPIHPYFWIGFSSNAITKVLKLVIPKNHEEAFIMLCTADVGVPLSRLYTYVRAATIAKYGEGALPLAEVVLAKWADRILINNPEGRAIPIILEENSAAKSLVRANAEKGAAWEAEVAAERATVDKEVQQQLTVKTQSGAKTRIDIASKSKETGQLNLTEAKASPSAPLTKSQAKAFPEIEKTGATVVGQGKPGYPPGTVIPPTKVDIRRPKKQGH